MPQADDDYGINTAPGCSRIPSGRLRHSVARFFTGRGLRLPICGGDTPRARRVDVLVNSAGAWHLGFAEETAMEEAQAVMETNLYGVARAINACLDCILRRGLRPAPRRE